MACGDFEYLKKRTLSDKILKDKAYNFAKNPKYDGYQRLFDKKSASGDVLNNDIKQNFQLAKELHKPVIRKFKKRKVYSGFKDNIWSADLADMQLISKFNKGFRFLLCVIDIFSKYAWVVLLKDKNGASIANTFEKILDKSARKPSKIWVNQGNEFYNSSF